MKTCSKCELEWPATTDNFYRSGSNGLRSECKSCSKKSNWYPKNGNVSVIKVKDKKEKEEFDFKTLSELSQYNLDSLKITESKQKTVHIEPINKNRWLGIAVFGDLHMGDYYQDLDELLKHTDIVINSEDVIAVQVGDILSNQSSFTHRGQNREAPRELSLALQKKAAKMWFKRIGEKMAAFIIGNHDIRSLYSEGYDIGEMVVDEIKGAYLGAKGSLFIKFSDEVTYEARLVHGDREGYSMWNPNHPGARVQAKRPNIDLVFHGHIHSDVAYQSVPIYDGHRAVYIRSSGYTRDVMLDDSVGIPASHYAWKRGEGNVTPRTPIVLLNPIEKQIIIHEDLVLGLRILKCLNNTVD